MFEAPEEQRNVAPQRAKLTTTILRTAVTIADHAGHYHIEPCHLFAGLIHVGTALNLTGNTADPLLITLVTRSGITAPDTNRSMNAYRPIDADRDGPRRYSPAAQTVLTRADTMTSLWFRHPAERKVTQPEHLLLALLQTADEPFTQFLRDLGADPAALNHTLNTVFTGRDTPEPTLFDPPADPAGTRRSVPASLAAYGRDLTAAARAGILTPVIGRDREIGAVIQTLLRRTKNNPCLVGPAGVGKTAVVEGVAQHVAAADAPADLAALTVFELDLAAVMAGTRYRGDMEERITAILTDLENRDDIIVFIDEIHMLADAGSSGTSNVAQLFKPAMARGQLRLIGATTDDEYRSGIESDAALERRFHRIRVDAPTVEDATAIVAGVKPLFEQHHQVTITDTAVTAAVTLTDRYVRDRQLPDKAIDVLDETAAAVTVARGLGRPTVTVIDDTAIAATIAQWTGVPLGTITDRESARLLAMETAVGARIIGQSDAVSTVARSVRRAMAGLAPDNRPRGSFLLLGPTGVGKTELAKATAEFLFGSETAMITIDMSEYQEASSIARLIGAPPGYTGSGEPGLLTEPVRRNPYTVVLLDEVEKAHPDVMNVLLQILDSGTLTDSSGVTASFRDTIVFLTSNLGSSDQSAPVGFMTETATAVSAKAAAMRHAHQFFRPELLNRFDDIVVFNPLGADHMSGIATKFTDDLAVRLLDVGVELHVSTAANRWLAAAGYDPELGARPMRRLVQQHIENPVSELLLTGAITAGMTVTVDRDLLGVSVTPVPAPTPVPV